MAQDLIIHEPIDVPYRKPKKGSTKFITNQNVRAFWQKPEAAAMAAKQGCYVFALRASKGFTPWYAGMATKSFRQETLHSTKLAHYNEVLFDGRKGKPVIVFIAPSDKRNKVPAKICDVIETFLIQSAYKQNPKIKNRQKTKMPNWTIAGVVRPNRGPVSKTANDFKKMMGLT